jgi:Rrf2 family protein
MGVAHVLDAPGLDRKTHLMHLSMGVESMLHSCALLALLPTGKSLPAAKLAEYHGLPAAYLAKQLQTMAAAGLVEAGRGRVNSGYRLARSPDQITLLDVVDAIEGPGPVFRCADIRFRGPCAADEGKYPPVCAVTTAMRDAEQAWRDALARTTVADLVTAIAADAVPEVVEKSIVWLHGSVR